MRNVIKLKTAKARCDESLAHALMSLVEQAEQGHIDRMVCVCLGPSQDFFKVTHNAADLSVIGALGIVVDDLKSTYWNVV